MKNLLQIGMFLFIALTLAACGSSTTDETGEETNKIYVTIYPLQFLVEEIAGDAVEVNTVYPPGVDEHTYEPTAKDITNIAEADAFFYIGAGLEALATTTASALENQEVELIEIGKHEELFLEGGQHPEEHGHHEDEHDDEDGHHEHHHGDLDPHLWLDPLRMIDIAAIVKDELVTLYPEEAEKFEENLTALEEKLITLDEEFINVMSQKENKKILVTHAAFGYWEERYGIEQIAIHGLSTENEPSQKDLIAIIDTAREHDLEHIIFEQNVTTNVSKVIQEEIGAEALTIHNLAVLTEEDLEEGRDYLSIMQNNLRVLDEALR